MSTEMEQFQQRMLLVKDLEEYVQLEGSEIGEACSLLCQLSHYAYCLDDKFVKALDKELASQLKMFREQCTIVEVEEVSTHKYKQLDWN